MSTNQAHITRMQQEIDSIDTQTYYAREAIKIDLERKEWLNQRITQLIIDMESNTNVLGDKRCPHCGRVTYNSNPHNTFARCYICYEYFDLNAETEGDTNGEPKGEGETEEERKKV